MENKTFLVTRDDTGLPTLTQVYTRWHRFKYAATGPSTQADAGLNTMTQNYTRSHRITHADTGLHTLTQDYTRSHRITHTHTGLHTLTLDYTCSHRIARTDTELHALTQDRTTSGHASLAKRAFSKRERFHGLLAFKIRYVSSVMNTSSNRPPSYASVLPKHHPTS